MPVEFSLVTSLCMRLHTIKPRVSVT